VARNLRREIIKSQHRINNRIRARELRLIDEQGTQVGIISLREAQELAEERGLDLVEVAPNASPPVCRLMDYGKFRYEQSKKEREARKNQKQTDLKEVRLKPRTDEHDLEVKANRARKFLKAGDKVKFTVRFRGRELAHTNIGREMLERIIELLQDIAVVEQKPTLESRALSLTLAPNSKTVKAAQQAQQEKTRLARAEKQHAREQHDGDDEPEDDDDFDDEDEDDFDEDDIDDEDDFDDEQESNDELAIEEDISDEEQVERLLSKNKNKKVR
jgi:translation initiation factor IF-3